MSVFRPWDFSNPNETILDKRSLRSAFVDTIKGYDVAVLLVASGW
jgi:hypothetical protein